MGLPLLIVGALAASRPEPALLAGHLRLAVQGVTEVATVLDLPSDPVGGTWKPYAHAEWGLAVRELEAALGCTIDPRDQEVLGGIVRDGLAIDARIDYRVAGASQEMLRLRDRIVRLLARVQGRLERRDLDPVPARRPEELAP